MPLRICILQTDILRPELIEQYHSYGHMFSQLFAQQPLAVTVEIYNVVDGHYPPAEQRFSAYLVTGSKADAFGTEAWIETLRRYLLQRYQQGDKLLGICFGHQLLALLLGGACARAEQGWGLGVQHCQVLEQPVWMHPASNQLSLLASHQDQVSRLPDGATLIASSAFCPIAAYAIGQQVLCFQGHPEFVPEYAQALLRVRQPSFAPTHYQQALDSLQTPHQGSRTAQWMLRFVAASAA
jgi:GMP synthase-like glutamine amidotransferase